MSAPTEYADWEAMFNEQPIERLIGFVLLPEGLPTFAKLAALRNRFLDVAFHDKQSTDAVRELAACWARALESLFYVLFSENEGAIDAFAKDKESGIKLALEYGYGSVMFVASRNAEGLLERLADGASAATEAELGLRSHLIAVAFGSTTNAA